MSDTEMIRGRQGHRLLQLGMLLFLFGLLVGFVVPMLANPRMGLTSHLEGVMNGTVLMVLGLIWPKLRLTDTALRAGFWLALFGTFTNWGTALAAGVIGAGEKMMPIAAEGYAGSDTQELLIAAGLLSLSFAMVTVSGIVLWGLRGVPNASEAKYIGEMPDSKDVRRFFNLVEESVKKATAFAVFEPNDASLWEKVKVIIDKYLNQKWEEGMLVGAKPEEAFFVKVGLGETMTEQDILEGRLIVQIGMAVVRPAEFVIFRIGQKLLETRG